MNLSLPECLACSFSLHLPCISGAETQEGRPTMARCAPFLSPPLVVSSFGPHRETGTSPRDGILHLPCWTDIHTLVQISLAARVGEFGSLGSSFSGLVFEALALGGGSPWPLGSGLTLKSV